VPRAIDLLGDAASTLRARLSRRGDSHLTLVTPWPPEQSGIAYYSARLAAQLARSVDVDVLVSGPLAEYEAPESGVRLHSASSPDTAARLKRQRHVLYCMGNSGFHAHVYSLLREHPGAVLLHDVQLTGFFGAIAGSQRPEDPNGWLLEAVERHYGGEMSRQELRAAMLSSQEREARGIYMTAEIKRFATRLFVHSRFAQEVLARDRGTELPVSVMPFGIPPAHEHGARSGVAAEPLIVHMGALSETKSTGVLIEAFGAVRRRQPGARLVLAGSADESGLAHWQALAREHAPEGSIEICGYVDRERYETLLRSADVAVQLRAISNGEASAAVADCLAAAIPTIVTDLGWTGELPRSAVSRLPPNPPAPLLAERIQALIADQAQRQALSAGALAFARENGFATVADAYLRAFGLA
jgi:glycosyltransferase involved in cell wall biosynthesis